MTIREEIGDALAGVYSGAGRPEVDALIDQLLDRGLVIVRADDLADRIAEDYDFDHPLNEDGGEE